MNFLNSKRLKDYPRLMFIVIWTILIFNIVFRDGWLNATRQIIGSDFLTLYSAGITYRTDITRLYDLTTQATIQQRLILPTTLPGLNPFISPPYVAAIYSLFTYLPYTWAFIFWTVLTLLLTFVSVRCLWNLLPDNLKIPVDIRQLLVITLSFFPFIEGFQVGQNHALTLLLVTLIIVFSLSERWFLAGMMAGLMIYKPQMVLGLLLVWIIWRKYKALTGFTIVVVAWIGSVLLINGPSSFLAYLNFSREIVLLPYVQGFPGYLLVTLYGLLTSLIPAQSLPVINIINGITIGILAIGLAWIAFKSRQLPILERTPVLALAFLIPYLVAPYVLLHDLVILIPLFVLWAKYDRSRYLLYGAIIVYLSSFFLPLFASLTKVALMSFITLGLVALIFAWTVHSKRALFWRTSQ